MFQNPDNGVSTTGDVTTKVRNLSKSRILSLSALALLLLGQLYLVWFKSFNWDEFLHFGQVYEARAGTLNAPFQVLHSRILAWAPEIAEIVTDQMRAARLFMWACTLVTIAAIYGLARRFTDSGTALIASIAYLGAGFVFTQSFSIRADPMAAAALMSALYLLGASRLSVSTAIATGALIGLSGMITVKSIFYAPCFFGLAWLVWSESEERGSLLVKYALVAISSVAVFLAIYFWHTSNLAPIPERFADPEKFVSGGSRWIVPEEFTALRYIPEQAGWGVVFLIGIVLSPIAWRKYRLSGAEKFALMGLAAPLLTLFFYRNTFPYYFVFLLPPVAVAISASWKLLAKRYGQKALLALLLIAPIALTLSEPRDYIVRQNDIAEYLRSEFPEPVPYLARSSFLPDYPRIISHLATGPGMAGYHSRKEAVVANYFEKGELPFILASGGAIYPSLQGIEIPNTFMPQDLAVMRDEYAQQWGPIFREGKEIPEGEALFTLTIPRDGPYTLEGNAILLDGRRIEHGTTIELSAGQHSVRGTRTDRTILWRGSKLPAPPPVVPDGVLYTRF